MGELPTIKQHPCNAQCPWHGTYKDGKEYDKDSIFPDGICPFLYHSLYPYFLGLLYHADMQDIWVCCPAEKGVDVLVRRQINAEPPYYKPKFESVNRDWWVIYAEVVNEPECPYKHYKGQRLLFPTADKKQWLCPAGLNNMWPFLKLEIPTCINLKNIRCPDWKDTITYDITRFI